jgi:hypothetical protein
LYWSNPGGLKKFRHPEIRVRPKATPGYWDLYFNDLEKLKGSITPSDAAYLSQIFISVAIGFILRYHESEICYEKELRKVKILARGPGFGYPQRGFALLKVH